MASENIDVRLLQVQYEAMRKELDEEKKRNGGPTDPPGGAQLEARVAKLEIHAEYIRRDLDDLKADVRDFRGESKSSFSLIRADMKTDFRLVFGALIASTLGLAGLMAKGFGWL